MLKSKSDPSESLIDKGPSPPESVENSSEHKQPYISSLVVQEAVLISIMLFIGFLLPSYTSMTYLIFALTLLVLFIMEGKRPSSKLTLAKKSCSVLMLFHSLSFAVYIFGVILTLPKDLSSYSPEKILGMKELGISFTEGNKDVNFLVTFSPKVLGIIVAILLVLNQSQKDRGCYIAPKQHKELLTYCVWLICLASCVVLSVVQLLLFVSCLLWIIVKSFGDNWKTQAEKASKIITGFCNAFFIVSLPLVLYSELQVRLELRDKEEIQMIDWFLYPPTSSRDQYMLYCLLTISALVLMSFLQKAVIVEDDFENNITDRDARLVTYEPFKVYFLLPAVLFLNTCVYHTVFSLVMMIEITVLLFISIDSFYFKFVRWIVMPTTLLTLLWVYFSNLTGLFSSDDVSEMDSVLYLFQYSATLEMMVSFACFFVASYTATMGNDFEDDYFQFAAICEARAELLEEKSQVWQLRRLYIYDFIGFFLMILVLISACIEVTLFNVILIYMTLYYFGFGGSKKVILRVIYFFVTFFILVEYINSLYPLSFLDGRGYFFQWLDLQRFKDFKIFQWDKFFRDKVFIMFMVSLRRQIYDFLSPITEIQRELNRRILTKKSQFFGTLFQGTEIFKKVIFVVVLLAMIVLLTVEEVNMVSWGFLILLYVILTTKIAIKIHKNQPKTYKLTILKVFTNLLIGYAIVMLFCQTSFQILLQFQEKKLISFVPWLDKNIPFLSTYSEFFGLGILEKDKVVYKFATLSFFFIGSIILSRTFLNQTSSEGEDQALGTKAFIRRTEDALDSREIEEVEQEKKDDSLISRLTLFMAKNFPIFWIILIVSLALHWMISLSMFLCLLCIIYYLAKPIMFINNIVSENCQDLITEGEFAPQGQESKGNYKKGKTQHEVQQNFILLWRYNRERKYHKQLRMLKARQNAVFCILIIVGLAVIILYPTELIMRNFSKIEDKEGAKMLIFYLNWAGCYHRYIPNVSVIDNLYDVWGYLVIIIVMFIERYFQFVLYENIENKQLLLQKEIKEDDDMLNKQKRTREDLRVLIEAKNEAIMYHQLKHVVNCAALFVLLASVGYMSNVFSILYVLLAFMGFFFWGTELLIAISSIAIGFEYITLLINFSSTVSPMKLPKEVNQDGNYGIPVFDLVNNKNFGFNSFMYGMDLAQMYAIWFQLVLLIIYSFQMKAYTLPMNCSIIPPLKDIVIETLDHEYKERVMKGLEEFKEGESQAAQRERLQKSYEEIQKESAMSRWVVRFYYSSTLAQHIIVLAISILVLVQSISLVSIFILPILLFLLFKSTDKEFFLKQQNGWLKGLLIALILDVVVQLILQTPIYNKSESSERLVDFFNQVGWKLLWEREKGPYSKLDIEAFIDFLGKSLIISMIFCQYFSLSEQLSKRDKSQDISNLFEMGEKKGECVSKFFNNNKVKNIVLTQMDQNHREILVNEIEGIVHSFEDERRALRNPLLTAMQHYEQKEELTRQESESPLTQTVGLDFQQKFKEEIEKIEEEMIQFDRFVTESKKRFSPELNWFVRKSQSLRENYTNQILFLVNQDQLHKVGFQIHKGVIRIDTELVSLLRKDLKEWKAQKFQNKLGRGISNQLFSSSLLGKDLLNKLEENKTEKSEEEKDQPKLSEMKRVQSYLATRADFWELIAALLEAFISNAKFFAFFFMVLSMLLEGSLLCLPYPLAIFGYALLEEQRPKRWFWDYLIIYAIFLIFIKFTVQFDLGQKEFLDYTKMIYFGLEKVHDGLQMSAYILTQVIIIFCATLAKLTEDLQGFKEKDEYKIENIQGALERYLENTTLQVRAAQANLKMREFQEEESGFRKSISVRQKRFEETTDFQLQNQDFDQMKETYMIMQETQEEKIGKLNRDYFERLFPSVKEQKPGKDLYPWIFTFQLLILLYILFIWSLMTRAKSSLSEAFNISFLDAEMVTVFIIQFALICADRYLSVFNITQLKETQYIKSTEKQVSSRVLIKNFDISYEPRYSDIMLHPDVIKIVEAKQAKLEIQAQRKAEKRMEEAGPNASFHSEDYQRDGTLRISHVTTQKQMITKYYFLWVNLIFIHLLIFYYLPFRGNVIMTGETFCDPDEGKICNNFGSNPWLVAFYCLYMLYFWFSAAQIRHGYPEIRRSNFIMNRYDDGISGDLLFLWSMIPFLLEIKVLLDWTMSKTALDIFQWFKFTMVHYDLYTYRCGNYAYSQKKTGEPISRCEKGLCGLSFLMIIFLLLVGPLYLFSEVNTTLNPIIGAEMEVSLEILNDEGMSTHMQLFHTENALQIRKLYRNETDIIKSFNQDVQTRFMEPEQVQKVAISTYSDTVWEPVELLKEEFIDSLQHPEKGENVYLVFELKFNRQAPENARTTGMTQKYEFTELNERKNMTHLLQSKCSDNPEESYQTVSEDLLQAAVYLDPTQVAQNLNIRDFEMTVAASYTCKGSWVITQQEENEKGEIEEGGLVFYVFSEKLSPDLLREFTVLTIYTSVVLVLGALVREIFVTGTERIQFQMMTNSDSLLVLCEQIVIMRRQGRLDREEQLYFTLMEVMRSTELIKELTGPILPDKRAVMQEQEDQAQKQFAEFMEWKKKRDEEIKKQQDDEFVLVEKMKSEAETRNQMMQQSLRKKRNKTPEKTSAAHSRTDSYLLNEKAQGDQP